jgi:iron complex outermembrane receptor protein
VTHCTDFTVRTAPGCLLNESRTFSAPTWVLGLDYKPNEDILLYGKYSRGYRTGNIKSDVPIEFHVFEPERVDTFEVGAKTSFEGALRGTFNIAGFYNDFRNQQIQLGYTVNANRRDAAGNPLPTISVPGNAGPVNIPKSRIWGIEMDTRLHLFEGFTLDAAYSYLNTRILKANVVALPADNVYVVNPSFRDGDPLILSPKHKLTVTGSYRLPLDEKIGEITIGATYIYISDQISNYVTLRDPTLVAKSGGFDSSHLGARNLLNLNFDWKNVGDGPFDLSVFATNVTNKKYYSGINGLLAPLGFETATVGEPRIFGARVKVRFGGTASD